MSQSAHGDRVSSIPDEPREALPTLDELPDNPTREQRAAAYANMAAAFHHLSLESHAERVRMRGQVEALTQEIRAMAGRIDQLCAAVRDLSALVGAGQ